ncbi:MAG: SEC-C domain-containing protein [Deltaproteobacteria bacterium]|nr:SEC-C domain-containing protein [Deltaproteobacteria bacterium]
MILTTISISVSVRAFFFPRKANKHSYSIECSKGKPIVSILKKLFSSKKAPENNKLGRNDTCWCGSGKKYKRCHLDSDARKRSGRIADAAIHGKR